MAESDDGGVGSKGGGAGAPVPGRVAARELPRYRDGGILLGDPARAHAQLNDLDLALLVGYCLRVCEHASKSHFNDGAAIRRQIIMMAKGFESMEPGAVAVIDDARRVTMADGYRRQMAKGIQCFQDGGLLAAMQKGFGRTRE